MKYYKLEGRTPVPVADIIEWAKWYCAADRKVAKVQLPDGIMVSTVFLGLDHGWDGKVELFETMIFGGEQDGYQDRCATWEEAEQMHMKAIELAFTL